jgi:hypothetical protein
LSPQPAATGTMWASTRNGCWMTRCPDQDASGLPALGLARRYGDTPADTACGKALEVDVISVTKIARCWGRRPRTPQSRPASGRGRTGPLRPRPGRVRHRPDASSPRARWHRHRPSPVRRQDGHRQDDRTGAERPDQPRPQADPAR